MNSTDETIAALEPVLRKIARDIDEAAGNPPVDREDLVQEARIGAWAGLLRYQETKSGAELRRCILGAARRRALDFLREEARDNGFQAQVSLSVAYPDEDSESEHPEAAFHRDDYDVSMARAKQQAAEHGALWI